MISRPLLVAVALLAAFPAVAGELVGPVASIRDGGTFTIVVTDIRLCGIDAPEREEAGYEARPTCCGRSRMDGAPQDETHSPVDRSNCTHAGVAACPNSDPGRGDAWRSATRSGGGERGPREERRSRLKQSFAALM
jgi:hypothetical protein